MDNPNLAIAVSHFGYWNGEGAPVPLIESAVCDVCQGWATELRQARKRTVVSDDASPGLVTHVRTSRYVTEIRYACDEHLDQVHAELTSEYGSASDWLEWDQLADAVNAGPTMYAERD